MDLKCFLCESLFDSPQKLFCHLNKCGLPSKTMYRCTFNECFQKFHDNSNFQKHVKKHFSKSSATTSVQSGHVNINNFNKPKQTNEYSNRCQNSVENNAINSEIF